MATTKKLMLNIEYRTRNIEFRSFIDCTAQVHAPRAALFLMIEFLTSTFSIQYSILDI